MTEIPSPLQALLGKLVVPSDSVGYSHQTVKVHLSRKKGEPEVVTLSSGMFKAHLWEIVLLGGLALVAYAVETWGQGQGKGQAFPDWVAAVVPAAAEINAIQADINGQPGAGVGWTEVATANPVLALIAFALPEPTSFTVTVNVPPPPAGQPYYVVYAEPSGMLVFDVPGPFGPTVLPAPSGATVGSVITPGTSGAPPPPAPTSHVSALWDPPVKINLPPWWGIVLPTVSQK